MVNVVITAIIIALLVAASVWADERFKDQDRLPMQWSLGGDVNWTAPRRAALAFKPALSVILLIAINILVVVSGEPRKGQEEIAPLVVPLVGLVFLGLHALHLKLIDQHLRR